jgi:hypothetical protein
MKYKYFNGPDKPHVEAQINAWLKGKKIKVQRSDSTVKNVSVPYKDAKGKQKSRKVPYLAVNLWYEDEKSN